MSHNPPIRQLQLCLGLETVRIRACPEESKEVVFVGTKVESSTHSNTLSGATRGRKATVDVHLLRFFGIFVSNSHMV